MSTQPNAGAMPQGISRTRVMLDGRMLEIALDWRQVRRLAQDALDNKTGQRKAGPVVVRVVKP